MGVVVAGGDDQNDGFGAGAASETDGTLGSGPTSVGGWRDDISISTASDSGMDVPSSIRSAERVRGEEGSNGEQGGAGDIEEQGA